MRTFLCGAHLNNKLLRLLLLQSPAQVVDEAPMRAPDPGLLESVRVPVLRPFYSAAHPRKLRGRKKLFPRYDLPLNSVTPADHHAANGPIKTGETGGKERRRWEEEERGGRGKLGRRLVLRSTGEKTEITRLTRTVPWSGKSLHHAARFFSQIS